METFWFQTMVGFMIGLGLIFAGQLFLLWSITSAWSDRLTANPASPKTATEDRLAANQFLDQLRSRPERLAEVLATTTALIDPSR
ncbi:MAG: hypothetical protein COV08_00840 [Candidatus Vogelbacteria bacterium CG10_big_fil_rev_8_21_14_0_10_49_38]|uniref:Uncharacterized protein n=1 Tax=Candidatus Vogelbacteria bacterium CG10_big_fil_rev_8_21_14_0_10_49_38 TaxID=1975043 RepID=A0A2H0RKC3_9BACT|nr:MAG: hypothetical protein BK006_00845 [bacterium CG10_49_38]PIR46225.1 MAG: hypothetical protein COV08_00840 [Candidatus Vogelbacteria bacterium CG10_big_fil_rev_8_21_14_0_10_49_38]